MSSLIAVIYQRLLRSKSQHHLAYEILSINEPMKQLLARGEFQTMNAEMSKNRDGNITLNQSLAKLVLQEKISFSQASVVSPNATELSRLLEKKSPR